MDVAENLSFDAILKRNEKTCKLLEVKCNCCGQQIKISVVKYHKCFVDFYVKVFEYKIKSGMNAGLIKKDSGKVTEVVSKKRKMPEVDENDGG